MLIKKSITINKHRTSISLEIEFWDSLKTIAKQKNLTIERIISDIDYNRDSSLASSTRIFILKYFLK